MRFQKAAMGHMSHEEVWKDWHRRIVDVEASGKLQEVE